MLNLGCNFQGLMVISLCLTYNGAKCGPDPLYCITHTSLIEMTAMLLKPVIKAEGGRQYRWSIYTSLRDTKVQHQPRYIALCGLLFQA